MDAPARRRERLSSAMARHVMSAPDRRWRRERPRPSQCRSGDRRLRRRSPAGGIGRAPSAPSAARRQNTASPDPVRGAANNCMNVHWLPSNLQHGYSSPGVLGSLPPVPRRRNRAFGGARRCPSGHSRVYRGFAFDRRRLDTDEPFQPGHLPPCARALAIAGLAVPRERGSRELRQARSGPRRASRASCRLDRGVCRPASRLAGRSPVAGSQPRRTGR